MLFHHFKQVSKDIFILCKVSLLLFLYKVTPPLYCNVLLMNEETRAANNRRKGNDRVYYKIKF